MSILNVIIDTTGLAEPGSFVPREPLTLNYQDFESIQQGWVLPKAALSLEITSGFSIEDEDITVASFKSLDSGDYVTEKLVLMSFKSEGKTFDSSLAGEFETETSQITEVYFESFSSSGADIEALDKEELVVYTEVEDTFTLNIDNVDVDAISNRAIFMPVYIDGANLWADSI